MAKSGFCHCTASLCANGRCAYGCSPFADPAHLADQEHKRKANDAHRREYDRPFITPEDRARTSRALAKIDKFYAHAQRRRLRWGRAVAKRKLMGGTR